MSDLNALLFATHTLLLRARGLHEEVEEGSKRLKRLQAKIDFQHSQLNEHHERLKALRLQMHEKEMSLKANQELVKKYEKQRGTAASKKEFDTLLAEIDNVKQANRVIEDEMLDVMGALEEQSKLTPTFEQAVTQSREQLQKAEADLATQRPERERRLAETDNEVQAALAGLPAETRAAYIRLAPAFGADSLSAITGRSCSGCYMEVTAQQFNDLLASRGATCKSCGRLLYRTE